MTLIKEAQDDIDLPNRKKKFQSETIFNKNKKKKVHFNSDVPELLDTIRLEKDEERTTTLLDSLSIFVGPKTRVSLAKRASEIARLMPATKGLAWDVGRIITALLTVGGKDISAR